jgi:hypothetical protein
MNNSFPTGSKVNFFNTPFSEDKAISAAHRVGLDVSYKSNPLDIVPAIGNHGYLPLAVLYLPIYVVTGFSEHTKNVWITTPENNWDYPHGP